MCQLMEHNSFVELCMQCHLTKPNVAFASCQIEAVLCTNCFDKLHICPKCNEHLTGAERC